MRINDDLNNFVTTASHDLVAPLGNIEMSIAVMNSLKVADPELQEFLAVINTSIKKFRALIGEISTIARIENDAILKENLDIQEAISNIEWSLEEKIRESKAVIKTELNVSKIFFSRKNFRSILFNLISNAIKFKSDKAPVITVRTYQEGDNVMLSVEDNGIGISEEDSHKIWGMYHQLDHDIEGQGIGMFLTKKIVNSAGGQITVESTPGKGTKFIISFPL
jgi:signal transduction histidine kinase